MDLNKLKKTLEIVYEYLFRTVGICVAIAAFWLYFSQSISERMFWIGLGAGSAMGIFGKNSKTNFFKSNGNESAGG